MSERTPEQIATNVLERRMGSANCEDLETLARGYQVLAGQVASLRTALAAAESQRDAATGERSVYSTREVGASPALRLVTKPDGCA